MWLPNELWIAVFRHLPDPESVINASLACEQWLEVLHKYDSAIFSDRRPVGANDNLIAADDLGPCFKKWYKPRLALRFSPITEPWEVSVADHCIDRLPKGCKAINLECQWLPSRQPKGSLDSHTLLLRYPISGLPRSIGAINLSTATVWFSEAQHPAPRPAMPKPDELKMCRGKEIIVGTKIIELKHEQLAVYARHVNLELQLLYLCKQDQVVNVIHGHPTTTGPQKRGIFVSVSNNSFHAVANNHLLYCGLVNFETTLQPVSPWKNMCINDTHLFKWERKDSTLYSRLLSSFENPKRPFPHYWSIVVCLNKLTVNWYRLDPDDVSNRFVCLHGARAHTSVIHLAVVDLWKGTVEVHADSSLGTNWFLSDTGEVFGL